jgi:hypothetical protein
VLKPTSFILEAVFYWKRIRISIPFYSDVEIIPSPHSIPAPISPVYLFFSNQAPPPFRVDNIFNLKLDHAPFYFPTLSKEKRGIIETIL